MNGVALISVGVMFSHGTKRRSMKRASHSSANATMAITAIPAMTTSVTRNWAADWIMKPRLFPAGLWMGYSSFIFLSPVPRNALAERMIATLFGRLAEMTHSLETLYPVDADAKRRPPVKGKNGLAS